MIETYQNDLPDDFDAGESIAIDTETMGLNLGRDRLCLVQVSTGDGHAHLVLIDQDQSRAPNLERILGDKNILKIFHFGRFDIASLGAQFGVWAEPVYCTKIASKLARTYTDRHGLSALASELLGIDMSKAQQSSDWGGEKLSDAQLEYAASDVLYLHQIKSKLDDMLEREGRIEHAMSAFAYLSARAKLDFAGWEALDIFAH